MGKPVRGVPCHICRRLRVDELLFECTKCRKAYHNAVCGTAVPCVEQFDPPDPDDVRRGQFGAYVRRDYSTEKALCDTCRNAVQGNPSNGTVAIVKAGNQDLLHDSESVALELAQVALEQEQAESAYETLRKRISDLEMRRLRQEKDQRRIHALR